jgi:diguanylate cyclase (GGDEF)-like protein
VSSSTEAAQRLVQAIPKVVGCDKSSMLLFDRASAILTCVALHGFDVETTQALTGLTISTTDTPALGRMLEGPVPMFFDRDTPDPFVRAYLEVTGGCAMVVVPLVHRGRFYGVLTAGVDDQPERLRDHPDLIVRLNGLADQGAGALHNAELVGQIRHQALHDPLTGLPNRTLLEERATHLLAMAKRRHSHVGLLFVDLDRFKNVNDTRGHAAGDELIKLVGSRLEGCLRTSDTLARLGGDEFAVLLSHAERPIDGAAVARKLIAAIHRPFLIGHEKVFISCSIGIADNREGNVDYAELLRRADAAMYEAKANGRDMYAIEPAPALA